MRWKWAIASLLACAPVTHSAAQERAPDPLLIDRIETKIAENQRRLPNYTCIETIERSSRLRKTDAFVFVDTLRLEVALAEGKELFALPGARQFDEKGLWTVVTEATVFGGSEFALRAKNVLLTDSPSYAYAGEQVLKSRRAFRYDFRVGLANSHHTIRIGAKQARVGYHGSLWADAETLALIRLETTADDIPPDLEFAQESDTIEYQQTQIGESTYLLPSESELGMIDRGGMERRSHMQFGGCGPYGVSTAIFGRLVPTAPERQPKPAQAPTGPVSIAPAQTTFDTAYIPAIDPVKAARQELPSGVVLLARIKAKAAENLQRLPNYTCTETVERARRKRQARKSEPVDTLRLEVALVDGKELFSWPGAGKFEEKGIGEIVGAGAGGAISNGNFAMHAKSVFLSRWPTFTYTGETTLDGRSAFRYEYRVPQIFSGFTIRIGSGEAVVGYHGSFWVDANTLDLLRLEVHADDIPASLNLAEASDVMEYHRVRIGDSDFLLPEASELTMIDLAGNQNRNRTRLSACRQYTGESTLRFGDPVPAVAAPAPTKEIRLPAGLTIDVRLDTPIQSGRSATGDVVKAIVARNVTKDGQILVPKGAVLTGRLTRLEKHKGQDYYAVGLSFSSIEFEGARGEFHAILQNPGITLNSRNNFGRMRQIPEPQQHFEPGGDFAVPGSQFTLRRSHAMTWRTQD